jgi:ubiquinone/menaquinone biosynthesis C-methylase UbiE
MRPASDVQAALRAYWEDPATVSIIDKNLHELEIRTVCQHLLPTDLLADIGCGNGEATIRYARKVRACVAVERSDHLRQQAAKAFADAGVTNVSLQPGDIVEMTKLSGEYDVIVTQRLLINLASWEEQQHALRNLHRMLKPGGRYLMVENTNDAFHALNDMRARMELDPIPQHWHNRFFDYQELMAFMRPMFQLVRHDDFGLYYLFTRVYVPMFASFIGYGAKAVKDPIFEQADAAARRMCEEFGDRIRISGCRALGPIQVFVFRREATTPSVEETPGHKEATWP